MYVYLDIMQHLGLRGEAVKGEIGELGSTRHSEGRPEASQRGTGSRRHARDRLEASQRGAGSTRHSEGPARHIKHVRAGPQTFE